MGDVRQQPGAPLCLQPGLLLGEQQPVLEPGEAVLQGGQVILFQRDGQSLAALQKPVCLLGQLAEGFPLAQQPIEQNGAEGE